MNKFKKSTKKNVTFDLTKNVIIHYYSQYTQEDYYHNSDNNLLDINDISAEPPINSIFINKNIKIDLYKKDL